MILFLAIWLLAVSFLVNSFVMLRLKGLSFKEILLRTYKLNSLSALGAVAISSYFFSWIVAPLISVSSVPFSNDSYSLLFYLATLLLLYLFSYYFLSAEIENESLGSWLLLAQLVIGIAGYFGFKYLGML